MNTSNTQNTTSTPSAADARALLGHADDVSRQAASFSLAWLSYIALCAGGAVTAVGLAYANVTDAGAFPAWIAGLTWIIVGAVFTAGATVSSPPARRGLNARWGVMMALWVILWAVVAFLNSQFTLGLGIAVSSGFMALAILGPLWEIVAVRTGVK